MVIVACADKQGKADPFYYILYVQADIVRVASTTSLPVANSMRTLSTPGIAATVFSIFFGVTGTIHTSDSPIEILVVSNRDSGELGVFLIKTVSIDSAAITAAIILRVILFFVNLDL